VDYGVAIDPATGEFSGKAWGENIGWITFRSTGAVSYGITTSWGDGSDGDSDGNESGGGGCCQRSFKNEPFLVVRIEPH